MTPPDSTHIIRIDTGYITRRKATIPMEAIQKPDTQMVLTDSGVEFVYTDQFGQSFMIQPFSAQPPAPSPAPEHVPSAFDSITAHEPLAPCGPSSTAKYKALLAIQPAETKAADKYPLDAFTHGCSFFVAIITFALLTQRIYNIVYETRVHLRTRRGASIIAELQNQKNGNR